MSHIGTIKKWFVVGGFGWIQRNDGKDLFVHIRHCATQYTPKEGDRVQFDIAVDARNASGRADNVRPCNPADDNNADVVNSEQVEWLNQHRARQAEQDEIVQRMMDTTQPLPKDEVEITTLTTQLKE